MIVRLRSGRPLGAALPHPGFNRVGRPHPQVPHDHRRRPRPRPIPRGLIEPANTKIRLVTHVAFGFRSPQALIAPAVLQLTMCFTGLEDRWRYSTI